MPLPDAPSGPVKEFVRNTLGKAGSVADDLLQTAGIKWQESTHALGEVLDNLRRSADDTTDSAVNIANDITTRLQIESLSQQPSLFDYSAIAEAKRAAKEAGDPELIKRIAETTPGLRYVEPVTQIQKDQFQNIFSINIDAHFMPELEDTLGGHYIDVESLWDAILPNLDSQVYTSPELMRGAIQDQFGSEGINFLDSVFAHQGSDLMTQLNILKLAKTAPSPQLSLPQISESARGIIIDVSANDFGISAANSLVELSDTAYAQALAIKKRGDLRISRELSGEKIFEERVTNLESVEFAMQTLETSIEKLNNAKLSQMAEDLQGKLYILQSIVGD
jgi:hypothetical protein